MATQSISFSSPSPRDSTGEFTPDSSSIPTFKGRKCVSIKKLIKKLDEAQDDLAYTPCAFWACNGPRNPKPMCTCVKCAAMRNVGMVRAALAKALELGKDLRHQYSR